MPHTCAHRPYVSTYEGFKTLSDATESVSAQRDRANASAQEAWQRVAELEAVLAELVQHADRWIDDYNCVVIPDDVFDRARALLAKSK